MHYLIACGNCEQSFQVAANGDGSVSNETIRAAGLYEDSFYGHYCQACRDRWEAEAEDEQEREIHEHERWLDSCQDERESVYLVIDFSK